MNTSPDARPKVEAECHARVAAALDALHAEVEPAILYLGTPVVLIGTRNEDDSVNLAPMSSAWWLGWGCTPGLTPLPRPPRTCAGPANAC